MLMSIALVPKPLQHRNVSEGQGGRPLKVTFQQELLFGLLFYLRFYVSMPGSYSDCGVHTVFGHIAALSDER